MRKFWLIAALLLASPAYAFPPTAIPSPGYDRALAESRKARQMRPPVDVEPARPIIKHKLRRDKR